MTQPEADTGPQPWEFSDDDVLFLSACCWDYLTISAKAAAAGADEAAATFNQKATHQLVIQHKILHAQGMDSEAAQKVQTTATLVHHGIDLAEAALERENWHEAGVHIEEARNILEITLGGSPAERSRD